MNYKLLIIVFSMVIMLSACTQANINEKADKNTDSQAKGLLDDFTKTESSDVATAGEDSDGFVRLPGEPSRGNDFYYITGEVCEQFTKKFIEGILNKTVYEAKPSYAELTNCQYALGEAGSNGVKPNVLLSLSFLPIENQIKGHQMMKRTVLADNSIPMDNYIVKQDSGVINEIYLVIDGNKFLSINRSSVKALSDDEMVDFAQKIGEKIKNYK